MFFHDFQHENVDNKSKVNADQSASRILIKKSKKVNWVVRT